MRCNLSKPYGEQLRLSLVLPEASSFQRFSPKMSVFVKVSVKIVNTWHCGMMSSFIFSNEFTFMAKIVWAVIIF